MAEEAKLVGHNYVVAFDFGQGRSIQVNGNFYAGDDEATMSEKLDHIMNVLERQKAKVEIPLFEINLEKAKQLKKTKEWQIGRCKVDVKTHTENLERKRLYVAQTYDEKNRPVPAGLRQELQQIENMMVQAQRAQTQLEVELEDIRVDEAERGLKEARERAA